MVIPPEIPYPFPEEEIIGINVALCGLLGMKRLIDDFDPLIIYVAERKARKVKNPHTGKEIMISARKVPKFSAGVTLKAAATGPAVHTK